MALIASSCAMTSRENLSVCPARLESTYLRQGSPKPSSSVFLSACHSSRAFSNTCFDSTRDVLESLLNVQNIALKGPCRVTSNQCEEGCANGTEHTHEAASWASVVNLYSSGQINFDHLERGTRAEVSDVQEDNDTRPTEAPAPQRSASSCPCSIPSADMTILARALNVIVCIFWTFAMRSDCTSKSRSWS